MKKNILAIFALLLAFSLYPQDEPSKPFPKETVLVLCQPTVSQIRNIEELYEKDILSLNRLKLVGVFHESEETDYRPAQEYVKNNQLEWITFRVIRGQVAATDLFRENDWTPQFREIFASSSGIVFTGGMDIPPAVYGREQSLLSEVTTPQRSRYEISFLFHLIGGSQNPGWKPFLEKRREYPILAICLGAQSLNVAAGGTLSQDIPSEIYGLKTVEQVLRQDGDRIHSSLYDASMQPGTQKLAPHFHKIRLKPDSIYVRRMGAPASWQPKVLTSHHQAIENLGQNLLVTATSLDGKIVETLEHRIFPNVLAVQFHPEPFSLYMKGLHFRARAGEEPQINLRILLASDGISLAFHHKLWKWLAEALH